MKKVYCKNCKNYEPYNFWGYKECWAKANLYKGQGERGKIYQEFVGKLEKDISNNFNNNCNFYKEKRWWKFWVKENKRKILKGAQPKTDAGPKPDPELISYLEKGYTPFELRSGNKSEIIIITSREYRELCKYLKKIRS